MLSQPDTPIWAGLEPRYHERPLHPYPRPPPTWHPHAGMEPWDVTMSDLLAGHTSLDSVQGIVFVGGFSYADVLDSGGWVDHGRAGKDGWMEGIGWG